MTAAQQQVKYETVNVKVQKKQKTRSCQPSMKRDDYVCEWLFAVKSHVSIAGFDHFPHDGCAAAGKT